MKDGGPAFPRPYSEDESVYYPDQEGMSLRDWFAGQAMQGIIAAYAGKESGIGSGHTHLSTENINPGGQAVNKEGDRSEYDVFLRWLPVSAYQFADAMLAARGVE